MTTRQIPEYEPPTTAEKLHRIAEEARGRSMAQRYAIQNIKKAEELAEEGITEMRDKIMTLAFFKDNKNAMPIPEGRDPDEYIKELYDAQKESYSLMETDGFKVEYQELELPSTLDINMNAETRQIVEQTKRYTESMVKVSW